jgi:hypothetical protein
LELGAWHLWWKRRGGAGVRRLLMDEWDPIGVAGEPHAVDEYDTYVGGVGQMLREGKTADEIAAYLRDIHENSMGSSPSPTRRQADTAVAAHLVEWYAAEMRKAGRS